MKKCTALIFSTSKLLYGYELQLYMSASSTYFCFMRPSRFQLNGESEIRHDMIEGDESASFSADLMLPKTSCCDSVF